MKTILKKIILLNILIISLGTINAQWYMQQNPTTYNLTKIYMYDKNNGWIIGPECILNTTDGGMNWQIQTSPINIPIKSILFIDSLKGFISGGFNAPIGIKGAILKTIDGGKNWTISNSSNNYVYYDVTFIDSLAGWFSNSNGDIFKTSDGGINWLLNSHNNSYLSYIHFVNDSIGFGAGYKVIVKTTDGGENWFTLSVPENNGLVSFFFADESKGWMGGSGGKLFFTSDGGNSWDFQDILSTQTIQSLFFINDNGWAGGDSGHVFQTFDGGISWVRERQYFTSESVSSIFFVDSTMGWLTTGRNIFETENGGGPTNVLLNQKHYGYYLDQNYPNPFNPTTTIRYQIPQTGFVSLKVYDVLGKEVAILVNEEKPTGRYEVEFSGSSLPSGIYFYKLEAGGNIFSKRFLLLK